LPLITLGFTARAVSLTAAATPMATRLPPNAAPRPSKIATAFTGPTGFAAAEDGTGSGDSGSDGCCNGCGAVGVSCCCRVFGCNVGGGDGIDDSLRGNDPVGGGGEGACSLLFMESPVAEEATLASLASLASLRRRSAERGGGGGGIGEEGSGSSSSDDAFGGKGGVRSGSSDGGEGSGFEGTCGRSESARKGEAERGNGVDSSTPPVALPLPLLLLLLLLLLGLTAFGRGGGDGGDVDEEDDEEEEEPTDQRALTTARRRCLGRSGDTTCSQALLKGPGTTSGALRSVASTEHLATSDACME
jgi:hypothetical protein